MQGIARDRDYFDCEDQLEKKKLVKMRPHWRIYPH